MTSNPFQAIAQRSAQWCSAILMGLALGLGSAAVQASPTPLLTVSGANQDSGYIIRGDQAAAVSFIFDNAFSNVTITADLTKLSRASEGAIFLVSKLGLGAGLGDVVAEVDFNSISFMGAGTVLFTGLNLAGGSYAVVVANGQANPIGDNVIWNGSSTASVAQSLGVHDGIDFFAADTSGFLFNSLFTGVLESRSQAFFAVTANEVTSIPEPGSLLLVFLALGSLVWVQVKRQSSGMAQVSR